MIVTGLGEILWDLYPDEKRLGGAPANAAVHARLLGADAAIASGVGRDWQGEALKRAIALRGVDTGMLQVHPEKPTGTVRVTLDAQGVPSFDCSRETAFDYLLWTPEWEKRAAATDAVIFGTLAQRNPVSRETIRAFLQRAEKSVKVFDVNVRGWQDWTASVVMQSLQTADILKVNGPECARLKELHSLTESEDAAFLMRMIPLYGLKMAALSLGADGCLVTDGQTAVRIPGLSVRTADTTGCGDAFTAALTLGFLRGDSLERIARRANTLAALTATKPGAVPEFADHERADFFREAGLD